MTIEERISNHVCVFCESTLEHYEWQDPEIWGNNPDNACSIPGARCCNRCNRLIVRPVRQITSDIIEEVLSKDKTILSAFLELMTAQ